MENKGALCAIIPVSNKSQFRALPEKVVEKFDLVFYGNAERAVTRALEG